MTTSNGSSSSSSFFSNVSSALTSWSTSLQKETEQNFPGTVKRFGDLTQLVQQKARELPSNLANLPGAFEAEHEQFVKGNTNTPPTNERGSELVAPWQGYGAYEKRIKERVMALSKDERNFTIPPPEDTSFQFDFKAYSQSAAAALKYDPELAKLRFKLVPQHVTEPTFWRNYFYRVTLEKQAALSSTDIDPTSASEDPHDILFDFAPSDDEQQQQDTAQLPEIDSKQKATSKKTDADGSDPITVSAPPATAKPVAAESSNDKPKDYDGMEEWERELRKAAGEMT